MRKYLLLSASALASLTLAASLTMPASAAERSSHWGHAATSALEVGGTVTSSGKNASGVKVTIHAWPKQAAMQALKIGQKVPRVLVGSVMTDASGKYSVSIPLAKLMPESSYGVVNLEADSSAGSSIFPVVVTKDAGNSFLAPDPVADISGGFPGTFKCHGDWFYQKSMGKHFATVGETYVPGNVAKQKFTYSKGQTSALGVGWSISGDIGTFSEVGITAESDSLTEAWPTFGPNRSVFYRTEFHYGEYKCFVPGGIVTGHGQMVNGYAGGAVIKNPPGVPPTPNRFCVPQIQGSKPSSNNTVAVTWRKTLGLTSQLGFEATTETGFDTSAQLQYIYLHKGRLCGWADNPGGDPRQLVARVH